MSRMVSRWVGKIQGEEVQGYMNSKGQIKYSYIKLGRNRGDCTVEKEELVKRMTEVFNEEAEAKEEFELLGFLL